MYSLPRVVEFHRQVPGYWEKDDHDTLSDDVWPTQNPEWMLPMTFEDGLRIFREQVPLGERPYRTVRWGKGLQIWIVEGRDFRSPNTMEDGPEKTIWGFEQREWLMQTILESDAVFKVLISPTPIVGPDRPNKRDNHSNAAFAYEGNLFRNWTKEKELGNFYIACGDRHWQYMSVDPKTGLREFSSGPASDVHAGGTPGQDQQYQPFHRVAGGFLTATVTREDDTPVIIFRFHDIDGDVIYEYKDKTSSPS
jgi:alkaline phosphatase D